MKKLIVVVVLLLALQSCSTLDLLSSANPFKEDKGMKISAQIGKNNTQTQTDNKSLISASTNDKVDISNTSSSDNKSNVINQSTNTSADKSGISTKSTSSTTNDNKADVINQETSSITNYPTPVWLILAFAAMSGIAIPNPFNFFSDRRKRREREESKDQLIKEIEYLRGKLDENNKTFERQMAEDNKLDSNMDSTISVSSKSIRSTKPR